MTNTPQHVAEFNWGILLDDWDTPAIAEFQDNLDRVNAIAERADGFVWRMGDDAMGAAQMDPDGSFGGNPRLASTLSVWKSAETLENFVHKTVHGTFMKNAHKWFIKQEGPTYVIWPVPVGETPTIKQAVKRLNLLGVNGPTTLAYDFKWLRESAVREKE